jgi:hypothetical protein
MGTLVIYALLAIGIIAAAAGLHHAIDKRGYDRGVSETTSKWQSQVAKDKAEYDRKKAELEERAAEKERAWSELLAGIDSRHQKEIRDAETRRRNDVSAARRGAIRLRDPGGSSCSTAGGNAGSSTASPSGVGDAKEGSYLSRAATEFLLDLVNEADEVVVQLWHCQAIIEADRHANPR